MFCGLNNIQIMMLLFSAAIILILIYEIVGWMICNLKKVKTDKILVSQSIKMIRQFLTILTLISMFNVSALVSDVNDYRPNGNIYFIWSLTAMLFAIYLWMHLKNKKSINIFKVIREKFSDNEAIIFVLFIVSVCRIIMFSSINIQRWDAGEYYWRLGEACINYNFTWQSVWEYFRLCNHSSIGFAFLYAIGEFLNPRGVQGVLYVNLLLTIVALYMIYVLLQNYWANFNKRQAVIGTLLVAVAPLFWGTCGYLNTDYTLALIFIFLIYAQYKKHYIELVFWGIIITQTKETGVFVIAGYYLAHFIMWMSSFDGKFIEKINGILKEKLTWCIMTVALLYARYIYKLRAFTAWSSGIGIHSEAGMNTFGIYPEYILLRMKQYFICNFNWIMTIILIVSIVIAVKKKIKISLNNLAGIFGAFGGFVLLGMFYMTSEINRYNILPSILLILCGYICAESVLSFSAKKTINRVIWGIMAFIFIVQNFYPIDVVSNYSFKTVSTGKGKMLFTSDRDEYFGDYLVNNYQYTWLDKALDKLLKEVNYNDSMTIYVPQDSAGCHIQGNPGAYNVYWDNKEKCRVMYENSFTEELHVEYVKNLEKGKLDVISDKAVIFFVPYYEVDINKELERCKMYYSISDEKEIAVNGGNILYYSLLKK